LQYVKICKNQNILKINSFFQRCKCHIATKTGLENQIAPEVGSINMQNSKLISLLRSFSARERRSFRDLVASPYFNRNGDLMRLADWLDTWAPEYANVEREAAHQYLFPNEKPDEARLNHLMSFLLKLAEDFVGLEGYWTEKNQHTLQVLKSLESRNLEKHYQFNLQKARRSFELEQKPSANAFLENYSLEILEAEHFARNSPRQFNESVQKATDNLDAFYLLEKLRRTCYMYTSQAILATPYNLQLVEEICKFTESNLPRLHTPAIEAYFRVYQLLVKEHPHEDFKALKNLIAFRADEFNAEDLSDIYQYAINFCNIQINRAQESYLLEAFELYIKGLDSGIMLSNQTLSPWHFKNIINLTLRLKKYDWAENFIVEKNRWLPPEFQVDALHYNLAQLYYNTGRRSEAMFHLNQVEFTDIHYSLGGKFMLCQIYYENDDFDALESLLHAFNIFLRRNKLIAEQTRQAFLTFVQIMRKILRTQPQNYPAVIQQIESNRVIAGKDWLLKILS
jgi:hypothetical protein